MKKGIARGKFIVLKLAVIKYSLKLNLYESLSCLLIPESVFFNSSLDNLGMKLFVLSLYLTLDLILG